MDKVLEAMRAAQPVYGGSNPMNGSKLAALTARRMSEVPERKKRVKVETTSMTQGCSSVDTKLCMPTFGPALKGLSDPHKGTSC